MNRAELDTLVQGRIGVGLRAPHMAEIMATRPPIGWLEVHAENYMENGPALARLLAIRRDYPLSLHGVGLSLGSADGIDERHLRRLAALAAASEPFLVSEHLAWSVVDGGYLNDLLPLPLTEEVLDVVVRNVERTQAALGRTILVENPSSYLRFRHSTIPEPDFLAEIARRTGCGLLCDVNNIFVSCSNFGADAEAYLAVLAKDSVGEIHLAGHWREERRGTTLLIDDHGSAVSDEVWALYRAALRRFGLQPTLVEWDRRIPPLETLIGEARKAERMAAEEMERDARAA